MNLRDMARAYTVEEGVLKGTTFWMLPFRTGLADLEAMEAQRAEPEWEYRHPDGRRQSDEPADLKAERERVNRQRDKLFEQAVKFKREPDPKRLQELTVKSPWERVRVWGLIHDTFFHCFAQVVALDFPEITASTPSELRVFADYWQHLPATVMERFETFKMLAGTNVINTLWDAYGATRDQTAQAAPELGPAEPDDQADPKGERSIDV